MQQPTPVAEFYQANQQLFVNLAERYDDEREFEPMAEYAAVLQKQAPADVTITAPKRNTKHFMFVVQWRNRLYKMGIKFLSGGRADYTYTYTGDA